MKVTDEGKGIFEKNGKLAMENEADLAQLVLHHLLRESWEVVEEQQLTNILPLHLAPKPGKEPPWRLICDGRKVNEHVKDWKFKMETLRTLPMVVNPGDWMVSCDLEDAYYTCGLKKESRGLFGAKFKAPAEVLAR